MKWDKKSIVRCYCYLREGERSVHRALDADWRDFRAYYSSSKVEAIRGMVIALERATGMDLSHRSALSHEQIARLTPSPGIWRYYLSHWLATRKRAWTFPEWVVTFIVASFCRLLTLLESGQKPNPDVLMALRLDFCVGEYLIESRCHGLAELRRAGSLVHFQCTDWLPHVTLEDILGVQPRTQLKRKSA